MATPVVLAEQADLQACGQVYLAQVGALAGIRMAAALMEVLATIHGLVVQDSAVVAAVDVVVLADTVAVVVAETTTAAAVAAVDILVVVVELTQPMVEVADPTASAHPKAIQQATKQEMDR
jgi:hypothetical protein